MSRRTVPFLLAVVVGCAGTDVGNPPSPATDEASVSLTFRGVDRGVQGGLVLASGDEVTEAWLVLDLSAAMRFGTTGSDKVGHSLGAAAAVGFLTVAIFRMP